MFSLLKPFSSFRPPSETKKSNSKKSSSKKIVCGGCKGFRTIKGDDGFFTRVVPCCGKDLGLGLCKRHQKESESTENGHLDLGEKDHPYPQTRYTGEKLKTLVNHHLYGEENRKNLNYVSEEEESDDEE